MTDINHNSNNSQTVDNALDPVIDTVINTVNNNPSILDNREEAEQPEAPKIHYARGMHPNTKHFTSCGNPKGRPKQTQEQKDALEMLRKLAPQAVKTLADVLQDKRSRGADRLKAAELIIERTYGKAPATVNVNAAGSDIGADIKAELNAIKAQFADEIQRAEAENKPQITIKAE